MTDLLRISRPWLLSSFKPPVPALLPPSLYRNFSTTSLLSKIPQKREGRAANLQNQHEPAFTFLIPKTFVTPPLWRFPRDPMKFANMLWLTLKNRFVDLQTIAAVKVMSMDKLRLSRPRFQLQRATIVPAAKALHIQMSEAMAAGDKETLRSICAQELYQTLAGAIDGRPKGVHSKWELVRYEKSWRYPRLASLKLGNQPHTRDTLLIKQAVVSIASVQRIARYDDSKGGIIVDGSERVRHMVEHIVLQCAVNPITYEASPWQIWGTLPETTYESLLQDIQDYDDLAEEHGNSK
ncbi:uncharacterized protein GGS22DRAFT_159850 [Annulohypoxylon maeteangense]|uniref:uncharacterized protein n=1 Tax=Annulohypoxylon maeteangense TaxID=1927788 RepID=UPI0020089370|nr:uncharacterized protein GGS22DRAFT_159850 [Annulohypoxylon maeteangense]KAI0886085.1 hypothetical protein GGS22DRAFT_159850 [Annulohypoxylon maeteangense]